MKKTAEEFRKETIAKYRAGKISKTTYDRRILVDISRMRKEEQEEQYRMLAKELHVIA